MDAAHAQVWLEQQGLHSVAGAFAVEEMTGADLAAMATVGWYSVSSMVCCRQMGSCGSSCAWCGS